MAPEAQADVSPPAITDAMIRAGVIQFLWLDPVEDEPEEIVRVIYAAMHAAGLPR